MPDLKDKGQFYTGFCVDESGYDKYIDEISNILKTPVVILDAPLEYPVLCVSVIVMESGLHDVYPLIDTFFLYNKDLNLSFTCGIK